MYQGLKRLITTYIYTSKGVYGYVRADYPPYRSYRLKNYPVPSSPLSSSCPITPGQKAHDSTTVIYGSVDGRRNTRERQRWTFGVRRG